MSDIPERFFISEDGQWNADPIEPCMIEAVSGEEYHTEIRKLKQLLIAAEQKHAALVEVLRRARSDIFQTARSNQCNLTGKDITFLHDAAQPERIGKTPVHQAGITESLSLVKEIDATLAQQDQPAGEWITIAEDGSNLPEPVPYSEWGLWRERASREIWRDWCPEDWSYISSHDNSPAGLIVAYWSIPHIDLRPDIPEYTAR